MKVSGVLTGVSCSIGARVSSPACPLQPMHQDAQFAGPHVASHPRVNTHPAAPRRTTIGRSFMLMCAIAIATTIALVLRPTVPLGWLLAAELFAVAVLGLIHDDETRPKRRPNKIW